MKEDIKDGLFAVGALIAFLLMMAALVLRFSLLA